MIPEWDLGDRLRKSLRHAGLSTRDMAEYLGVHRETIWRWTKGQNRPAIATLRAWAQRTGVDYDWLVNGQPEKEKEESQ
jgi:transcriptional regulator with XRE-family HTH domain